MYCQEFYSGWLIEVAKQQAGYTFHCWLPNCPTGGSATSRQVGIRDRHPYLSYAQARTAAQNRVNLETARLALEHCYWRGREGDLDSHDYHFLVDFILGVIQHHENVTETAH